MSVANVVSLGPGQPDPLTNVEAEGAVLGAMMIDNSIIDDAARKVVAADFAIDIHARLFSTILALHATGKGVNPIILKPMFESDEQLAQVGGLSYLARLTGSSLALLAPLDMALQVHDLAVRRRIRDGLSLAVQSCVDLATPTANIISKVDTVIRPDGAGDDCPELPAFDPAEWIGKMPPAREFILQGWVIRGACGLLSGQEGVGKSLIAQQMATCAAAGLTFLGLEIEHVPTVYITCEDPIEELWRRQEDINNSLGLTMADLSGKLLLISLKGVIGNELGTFDADGKLQIAPRFHQIERKCVSFGAGLVFLDNAAHLFPGNENARHDVAAFLGLLERMSEKINGSVILLAHPNKQHAQGNKQGNEYSGSTGWSAHVRNRLFLDWADKDSDGNFLGDDGRVLRKSKANYGKKGEEIHFRWHDWAFVRDADLPEDAVAELREVSRANFENECFEACLEQRLSERRAVSEKSGANFAPKVFSTMPEARGCTRDQLSAAMDRLFRVGRIERGFLWRNSGEGRDDHGLRFVSGNPNGVG